MKNVLRCFALLSVLLVAAAFTFPGAAMAAAHAVSPEHGPALLAGLTGLGGGSLMYACVVVPIEGFDIDDCPNPGGLTELYVIRRRDVATFPTVAADGVTITSPLVPKSGAGFVQWGFAADTGGVKHKSSGDAGNQSIGQELNTYVPTGSPTIDAVVQSALNGDFIALGRDSKGQLRMIGDKYRGVKFEHDYDSGLKGTDKNGTAFKFTGEGFTHVPYYYTAAIPLKGVVPAPAGS